MMEQNQLQRDRRVAFLCLLVFATVMGLGYSTEVQALTMYSYIDDQGNLAYTDAPETIPEKYRARVKTHEQPNPVTKAPSVLQSIQQTVQEQTKSLGFTLPSFQINMEGLNPAQSKILTYAGGAAVVLTLMMFLSKSQLIRTLGLCLLLLIGIATPVLMYISDGGPMDAMKTKATATGQAQQDRLQQVPR